MSIGGVFLAKVWNYVYALLQEGEPTEGQDVCLGFPMIFTEGVCYMYSDKPMPYDLVAEGVEL